MASRIDRELILYPDKNVYGTRFRLYGKPATPLQFYITDSTRHFFRGVMYFDFLADYDSLAPVVNFFEMELENIAKTFYWTKD
jgi:hypothetical protein